ncbi:MAG: peptidylprolyl isomerase, partial [Pyrinomonadaceae bacterium]
AQGILDRAKAGEDFAALANEFSEDPGNKGPDGSGQGGLYKDVPKGRMVAPFEQAALALEDGQISPELVESDFGYHIIKLDRKLGMTEKDGKKEESYDVRHILIGTGYKDPDNPTARETPVKDYVKNKLEAEKEKKLLADIVASNNIQVPEDFDVPTVSDEQIQQLQQKQQMPPQGMPPEIEMPQDAPAKPDAKKPVPKKK